MTTTGKWRAILALAMLAASQAMAATEGPALGQPVVKTAAWERIGESEVARPPAEVAKAQAPGEEGMRARKAEMVRRMFWIMMAHR